MGEERRERLPAVLLRVDSQQRPWPRPVLVEGAGKDKIVLV